MNERAQSAFQFITQSNGDEVTNLWMSDTFRKMDMDQIRALLHQTRTWVETQGESDWCSRLERAVPYLAEAIRGVATVDPNLLDEIIRLYALTPPAANLRNGWLYWLAVIGTEEARAIWLQLVSQSPPECRRGVVWACSPYLQHENLPTSFLAELLTKSLEHRQLAGVALDVLNFRFREGKSQTHVASERVAGLARLMSEVSNQLARIEEGNLPEGATSLELSSVVNDSVALLVSLCDLVALCDYREGEGKLRQVATLKHRRVRTEANAALARMGFEDGKKQLLELAAEPLTRMRAIAYAEELGMEDQIDEAWRSGPAMAESHLAIWLAEPEQMGIAPGQMFLIDDRRWFWPGYDSPVDCYLFQFLYGAGEQAFTNIGIVGPMTYAFEFDLTDFSTDDMYAAFAGWQAEHDELYERSMDEGYRLRGREIDGQLRQLQEQEFEEVQPQFVAHFFGEWILVALATYQGRRGVAVVDDARVHWLDQPGLESNPQFAYIVYRGRRLLETFNETDD